MAASYHILDLNYDSKQYPSYIKANEYKNDENVLGRRLQMYLKKYIYTIPRWLRRWPPRWLPRWPPGWPTFCINT